MPPESAPPTNPDEAPALAAAAFKASGKAATQTDVATRRYAHVVFHHGEGQLPRTCEWCSEGGDHG